VASAEPVSRDGKSFLPVVATAWFERPQAG
jgi:hypothetical protein